MQKLFTQASNSTINASATSKDEIMFGYGNNLQFNPPLLQVTWQIDDSLRIYTEADQAELSILKTLLDEIFGVWKAAIPDTIAPNDGRWLSPEQFRETLLKFEYEEINP